MAFQSNKHLVPISLTWSGKVTLSILSPVRWEDTCHLWLFVGQTYFMDAELTLPMLWHKFPPLHSCGGNIFVESCELWELNFCNVYAFWPPGWGLVPSRSGANTLNLSWLYQIFTTSSVPFTLALQSLSQLFFCKSCVVEVSYEHSFSHRRSSRVGGGRGVVRLLLCTLYHVISGVFAIAGFNQVLFVLSIEMRWDALF